MSPAAVVNDLSLPAKVPESQQTPAHTSHSALFSLSGRLVVITGGGRGLGIALAAAVLEAGGHVACLDILQTPVAEEWAALQRTAKQSNLEVSYHKCDITNEEALESALNEIEMDAERVGVQFYGVVACAGIQQRIPAVDYPQADFDRIQRVNVTGSFLTAKHTARILIKNRVRGSIVLIASMSGQIANRGLTCTAYNTSKAAVQQMCRSLAQEWGQYGIRINTLSPGYIRTAMTDELLAAAPEIEKIWMGGALLGRLGAPEDFKAPAVFLLSAGSSFMTGADLRVDGGHCASA
ncbi:short chain dehydrogenase [Xylaria sp. FL0043]|nr:short chain dehydrogenase [Xylaria sp. FL0043]